MSSSAFPVLATLTVLGVGLIAGVLLARARDQRRRDARRITVEARLPLGVATSAVTAAVRAIIGLGSARGGLSGRDSVVIESSANRLGIAQRLRLPTRSATYLMAELRAAIPGIFIRELPDDVTERPLAAVELRRRWTGADLDTREAEAIGRTLLAAMTRLSKNERLSWHVVVSGGLASRPAAARSWRQHLAGGSEPAMKRDTTGVVRVVIRIGATAATATRRAELVARLRRAAATTSAPNARLVPRLLPSRLVAERMRRGATPITHAPVLLRPEDIVALTAWLGGDLVPGANRGGSPQLPAGGEVPRSGRLLGRATADGRRVAIPARGAAEHLLVAGPTGSGKTELALQLLLADIEAGHGGLYLSPKRGNVETLVARLPESAISRTVLIDPMDAGCVVPLPMMGGVALDVLVHHFGDLGPRSTDLLASALLALEHVERATLLDVLRLWSDAHYRATVVARVADDPILTMHFAWFDSLGAAERSFVVAPTRNKLALLLRQPAVRALVAAPRATFTLETAMRDNLVVVACLPEGELGSFATDVLGSVITRQAIAAALGRRTHTFFNITIDEAGRFVDTGADLGEALARAREFSVGMTLATQWLGQLPESVRETALNSARSKVAFRTSARDAGRMAAEFGPGVRPEYFTGLGRWEAIAQVALGGTVSPPFTLRTEPLPPAIAGRAKAVRKASRATYGVPRSEIEASWQPPQQAPPGPVGRRSL